MSQRLEVTDPAAYRRKLQDQLAGRDPLEVIGQTPAALRALFAGVDEATVRSRPFPGKWTPLEVLGHLVDAEWSFGWRMRLVLGDDTPPIVPMDQEKWVVAQRHNQASLGELLDDFAALRAINLRLWRQMTPADLQRIGVHGQRGEESLDTMRWMLAGHDESHLDQIERYLVAARP
ncbi:DinB superfamily protein [Botrimarina colliarenosi]|uniref:DinB superfamily protein n=1 Tax=Botrimarina colliarenosi TaxID=2528001 RepID=A0A5C6AM68_9BACT|nr:DinB family protein [Botrimarina colliarenosi]TWU00216.1 DinB superfamily protein [Botrimarina colliarenosi]